MRKYCDSLTAYARAVTRPVAVGSVVIGGGNPVRIQSMTNTDTRDTAALRRPDRAHRPRRRARSCASRRRGCREAENLRRRSRERLRADGNTTALGGRHPFPARSGGSWRLQYVDKVRINPGNYRLDRGELEALVARCRERGVALRIGVNHGSLSKRIFDECGRHARRDGGRGHGVSARLPPARRSTKWSSR